MAFVIKKDKNYTWPCTISEPKDMGGFDDYKVPVKFKMLSQERIDDVIRNDQDEDQNILDEVLVGWDDGVFKDESGANMPFNDDNKRIILSVPYVRTALIKGFFASIQGKAVKRKN